MQQLAAKNTDIAALPISVSDAASGSFTQTIENGQQQSLPNGQSTDGGEFKAIYAQVSNENATQKSAADNAIAPSTQVQREESEPADSQKGDRQAIQGLTAGSNNAHSNQPASNPAPKNSTDPTSETPPSSVDAQSVEVIVAPIVSEQEVPSIIETDGEITQGAAKEVIELKPFRGGRIDLPPEYSIQPVIPSPLSEDNELASTETDESQSIISLVELMMQLDDSQTTLVNHQNLAANNGGQEATGEDVELVEHILPIVPELVTDEGEVIQDDESIANLDDALIANPVDSKPAVELTPVDGKPLPERMTIQPIEAPKHGLDVVPEAINAEPLSTTFTHTTLPEESTTPSVAEQAQALISMIQSAKQENAQQAKAQSNANSEITEILTSLESKISQVFTDTSELGDISIDEALAQLDEQLTSDESMFLSLIKDNVKIISPVASSDPALTQQVTGSMPQSVNSDVSADTNQAFINDEVLIALSEMTPESAQKAANAFADRIVSLMPNATAQQQQTVKANVVNAISEFQQQVAQGREPGIDISSMVTDAMKEANVPQPASQAVLAQLDTQVGAFMQLVNQSQSATYQSAQYGMSQAESLITENNQVRAESSKAQQQLDGLDKPVNVLKPEGQTQLSEKIRWMVNARNAMAEIRLDPPELGSMQVRVNVSGDAASVSFVVQSQHAKDALADTMPKLREMLQEQGISLGESTVRQDAKSQSNGEQGQQFTGGGNSAEDVELEDDTRVIEQSINLNTEGGIDFYA